MKTDFGKYVAFTTGLFLLAFAANCPAQLLSELKTFGTAGKQQTLLTTGQEAELFHYSGRGCLTHMWFGGSFKNYRRDAIRIYVDGGRTPRLTCNCFSATGSALTTVPRRGASPASARRAIPAACMTPTGFPSARASE